jgi:hypothetical protein
MNESFRVPPTHSATDWPEVQKMMQVFLRFITGCVGLLLVIVGLSFAFTAFNFVRDAIESPDQTIAYLAKWEGSFKAHELKPEPLLEAPGVAQPGSEKITPQPDPQKAAAQTNPEKTAEKPVKDAPPLRKFQQTPKKDDWEAVWRFLNSVSDTEMVRPLAALFLIILILILVRIPIVLIGAGGRLVLAMVRSKDEKLL